MTNTPQGSALREQAETSLLACLKLYMWPFDGRYEDLPRGHVAANLFRDFMAGLIVAEDASPVPAA